MLSRLILSRPLRKLAVVVLGYFSKALTLSPRTYVVVGDHSDRAVDECIERCSWYFAGSGTVFLLARSGERWRKYEITSENSRRVIGQCWLQAIGALVTGKVLLLKKTGLAQRLDAWLPWKCFLVSWDVDWAIGAWRFAAARESRPLARLKRTFRTADARPRSRECVVLGTGPSAHLALRDEFRDCDFVVCNTAIKSELLMRRRVVALCVADAAYFAAHHAYAKAVHQRMSQVVTARDISLYVDAEQEELWLHRIPNLRPERVFPVLFTPYIPYQPSFEKGRMQKNGYSVFTMLLLPVAATYYRKLHLVGFDGKSPDMKHYFWKHNDEFQYTELLPTVKEAEPGFFAGKDYNAYNSSNADSIAEAITSVQQTGVELVMSHPSFIPPLQELYIKGGTRLRNLASEQ